MSKIYHGDCLEVMQQWPDECVDMCVTSPPYWGLRDYGIPGQLGLEKTPEEFIEKLVAIFREVRRVLRPWGTVWLNMGDSYAGSWGNLGSRDGGQRSRTSERWERPAYEKWQGKPPTADSPGLKPKDLCMMPARVALALQADGWWLRSDIIWAKPNPMPESVTDRPTSSYEHIFLLTKSAKYFYDAVAVRVPLTTNEKRTERIVYDGKSEKTSTFLPPNPSGANLRNVWTITTQAYPEAHYATFPEELPRRCILAGTSAKGNCAECGKPWVRVVKPSEEYAKHLGKDWADYEKDAEEGRGHSISQQRCIKRNAPSITAEYETKGWQPSCKCEADTIPAIVLDPFFGSGTVGVVAEKLQRDWIGIEISREYIEGQAKKRTGLLSSEELMKDKPLFSA